jgi:hypothetical protein
LAVEHTVSFVPVHAIYDVRHTVKISIAPQIDSFKLGLLDRVAPHRYVGLVNRNYKWQWSLLANGAMTSDLASVTGSLVRTRQAYIHYEFYQLSSAQNYASL